MELKSVKRNEVEEKYTWDLTYLYKNEEDFKKDIKNLEEKTKTFVDNYKGKIDFDNLENMISSYEEIGTNLQKIYNYGTLHISVERSNPKYQEYQSLASNIGSKVSEELTFVESELILLDEDKLKDTMENNPKTRGIIHNVLRAKKDYLGPEIEKVLSALGPTFNGPFSIYSAAKHADLKFEDFEVDGKKYPLSLVLFENYYEGISDTKVRRKAFESFSKQLKEYENTFAQTFSEKVNNEKIISKLRGYDSVIDYLLYEQEISRDLYNRQIDVIMEKLSPVMRKYVSLIKKTNNLDKLTYGDLKISLDPNYTETISIEEAKEKLINGLEVLGPDYVDIVRRAFEERWIDFPINDGKSNGAFCSSPYGLHSFILNSWTGSLEDLFVLGHELGHAGHFMISGKNQNMTNTRPSLYFIEAPSTTNELIIANDMLTWSDDKEFKRFVYSSMISRTYYHNMVTHLLEAHFQRKVYNRVDREESISAPVLNELFNETLKEFWKDTVELTEGSELTWMRQLHYYKGLYPYTYSAGLTIGTQVSKRIIDEGEAAVKDWIDTLKAGGTKDAIGLAKMAGVDITTEKPLLDTISYLSDIVDEIEKITIELER